MKSLWTIYNKDIPEFITEIANTPVMLRLKKVGMHCGVEYTSFPQYIGKKPYSRWTHSVGVALIVWHFTGDIVQSVAGLLHDIASPTFAHVVDFLHGDYISQESTEDDTEKIIRSSAELMAILDKHGIDVDNVCDYHMYPVADNDSPQLSSDRLEYTLGNAFCHGLADIEDIRCIFDDLTVVNNEHDQPEIVFKTEDNAVRFAEFSLANSRVYSCDANRFAMQALADIIRTAMENGTVKENELYGTETDIINRICTDDILKARWSEYCSYSKIIRSNVKPKDGYWINVDAKRRYIDPMVIGAGRVTKFKPEYGEALTEYRGESYDYWMTAI